MPDDDLQDALSALLMAVDRNDGVTLSPHQTFAVYRHIAELVHNGGDEQASMRKVGEIMARRRRIDSVKNGGSGHEA